MLLGQKELSIPIIQGGMGIGVSMSSLAGAVAKKGGMGVISSVNAGYKLCDFKTNSSKANLQALKEEIKKAKEISCGNGLIAVNIMTAVSHYDEACIAAIEAGADAIISGAGLPLDLAQLTKDTDTLFAPIVSSKKAANILCRHYQRKCDRIPDFIVIEGSKAGGHLGFSKDELINQNAKSNDEILEEVLDVIKPFEMHYNKKIPIFIAGGVFDAEDISYYLKNGASGVQMATRFIATKECDASELFKNVILNAKKEDIRIIQSPVGMPARAVNSPLLRRLDSGKSFKADKCNGCLTGCKKGDKTPYCISRALIEAVNGNYEDGLFFCGENAWRIDKIVSVSELIDELTSCGL